MNGIQKQHSDTLDVVVEVGDRGVVWTGEASAVSGVNSQGAFDILPQHANFITIVWNTPLSIKHVDSSDDVRFQFEQAVVYARDSKVRVYAVA